MSEKLPARCPNPRHKPDMSEKLPPRLRSVGVRIVSLLPSTTEILFALGAGEQVVGVTFECDYPPEARRRPQRLDLEPFRKGSGTAKIDAPRPTERMAAGEDLYHLDEGALAGPGRRRRRHPGPVRGVRGRCPPSWTTPWLTSAVAPRWSRSTRTRWTRSSTRSRRCSARSRVPSRAPASWSPICAHDSAGWSRPSRVARRRGSLVLEWTDPPFAPGRLGAGDGRACRRRVHAGEWPGEVLPYDVGGSRREPPDLIVSRSVRVCTAGVHRLAQALLASGVLPAAYPCGRWMRTRRSPGPGLGSSTASRRWPRSPIPTPPVTQIPRWPAGSPEWEDRRP